MEGDRAASDADRGLAIASLREAAKAGVFDIDELQTRLDAVVTAGTVGELTTLTWDARLPVAPPLQAPPETLGGRRGRGTLRRNTGFRVHGTLYTAVNAFLVGTWGLTGHGFFWPFFPIAGWGIAVVIHASAVEHAGQKHDGAGRSGAGDDGAAGAGPRRRTADGGVPGLGPEHRSDALRRGVRYVTVVFVDVANSTALNEAMGDEAWSRARARHLARVRESVTQYGGTEVSTSGDGLFARFDLPAAAVGCAVEVQRRIEAEFDSNGFALRVRIGVHAGEAIEEESDLVGSMVNLASRVAAVAAPGEICVTEPVADKVSDRFDVGDRGLHTLKGIARPRHLLTVHW